MNTSACLNYRDLWWNIVLHSITWSKSVKWLLEKSYLVSLTSMNNLQAPPDNWN